MRVLLLVYFALFILVASSCQKSKEANVGVTSACVNQPASCNSSVYQQSDGYSTYSNNGNPFSYSGNSAYLCNCPNGSIPTYNSYAGLGCVQTSYYNMSYYGNFNGSYAMGFLYLAWGQNQWYPQSQLSTYGANCYNGAVQSCVSGQANTCPAGSSCMQNGRSSSLGLCVTSYR